MSCISSLPVWPSLCVLFLPWPALKPHLLVLSFLRKAFASGCPVYCCSCNIVTNITGEKAPLGCAPQYPPTNKQRYVIKETWRWTSRQKWQKGGGVSFEGTKSLTSLICLKLTDYKSGTVVDRWITKHPKVMKQQSHDTQKTFSLWANKVTWNVTGIFNFISCHMTSCFMISWLSYTQTQKHTHSSAQLEKPPCLYMYSVDKVWIFVLYYFHLNQKWYHINYIIWYKM